MSKTSDSRFQVNADDLRRHDWQSRLEQHSCKECNSYTGVFGAIVNESEAAGDNLIKRIYGLLHAVASFHANYDFKGNPFRPMWSGFGGNRAMMAEDLTDSDLVALRGIVEEIADPEFRARVSDVLWETQPKREYRTAQIAVQAYLESAERLKATELWPPYIERLERAAQLAARVGFGKPLHQQVLAVMEAAIKKYEPDLDEGLLCHRLMSFLLAHETGDANHYVALAERMAAKFAQAKNWDFSEDYWQLGAQWHRKIRNPSEVQRCLIAAAECLASKAEQGLENEHLSFGYASHWMGRAVEALRQAAGDPKRIVELKHRFLDLQHGVVANLKRSEFNVDKIPGFREGEKATQEAATAWVQGHDFETAVTRLATITAPTDFAAARKQVEEQSKDFIADKIMGSEALDFSGKVAETMPPLAVDSSDTPEDVWRKKAVQQAKMISWPLQVTWKIEPARAAITYEHGIRRRDLFFLVASNPFVPAGHEGIYLRGLQAGFFGEWLTAMNLLIPQIETSLRHVFQQHGVVTSTLEADYTQKERDINQLIWMPEMEEIFGVDVAFDLRGILVERFGHNMRNEAAHGLMPEGAFYQPAAVYLWWLILRLCWFGHQCLQQQIEEIQDSAGEAAVSPEALTS